jgi:cell wall-associated NlpC family hydrolase
MPARKRVVEAARSLKGTPWRHQGRSRSNGRWGGIDCAGLIVVTGRIAGVLPEDADLAGYRRTPDGRMMLALLSRWGTPVLKPQPGDVAAPIVKGASRPQHLGIVSELPDGRLGLVHACARRRRVVENSLDAPGQPITVVGYWAFAGLEDEPWQV